MTSQSSWTGGACVLVACSIALHLWAGWADEHRFQLQPVGHIAAIAFFSWVLTLLTALTALTSSKGRAPIATSIVILSVVALGLLVLT